MSNFSPTCPLLQSLINEAESRLKELDSTDLDTFIDKVEKIMEDLRRDIVENITVPFREALEEEEDRRELALKNLDIIQNAVEALMDDLK